jgi:hypothetical protein
MRICLPSCLLLVAVAVLAAGCGLSHETTRLNTSPRAMHSKPTSAVHVFTSGRPGAAYHEVFYLVSEEESARAGYGEGEILEALRERAGLLGCDALIVLSPTKAAAGRRPRNGLRATCAVYDDPTRATL